MARKYTQEENEIVAERLRCGESPKAISGSIGCNIKHVYYVAKKENISFEHCADLICDKTKAMREYKAQGHSYNEVAKKFNTTRDDAHNKCRGIAPQKIDKRKREERAKRYIAERTPGFEYAGGFIDMNSRVHLRCKKCGEIIDRNFSCVIHSKVRCPECAKLERRKRDEEIRKKKAKVGRERHKMKKLKNLEAERAKRQSAESRKHECSVCGRITINPKYCSEECRRKARNKSRETARRIRMQSAMIDRDITLRGLYKRDKGQCYICGMLCLWDDYITKDGATICGEWYPSIDHVIPLAKGGEHSWKNVRLAHRRCNSMKGTNDGRRVEIEY